MKKSVNSKLKYKNFHNKTKSSNLFKTKIQKNSKLLNTNTKNLQNKKVLKLITSLTYH